MGSFPLSPDASVPVACVQPPGVCAVNGLLYVVGGDDGSCNLASVEYYNPVTDKWTLLPTNMSTGRSYAGQCVAALPTLEATILGAVWGKGCEFAGLGTLGPPLHSVHDRC